MTAAAPELQPRWLTVDQAAAYLQVGRSTVYRLIQRGELVPDGRVGRGLRFSRETLDRLVIRGGSMDDDSVGHPAGKEDRDAIQDIPAQTHWRAGDPTGRPGSVPGARSMERREDGPEEEKRGHSEDAGQGGGAEGEAAGSGAEREAYKRAVRRLRRAVDEGSRA